MRTIQSQFFNEQEGKKEMFKTIVCKNYDEVSLEAFKVMKGVLDTEVNPILGLATGSTPVGLYKNMIKDH